MYHELSILFSLPKVVGRCPFPRFYIPHNLLECAHRNQGWCRRCTTRRWNILHIRVAKRHFFGRSRNRNWGTILLRRRCDRGWTRWGRTGQWRRGVWYSRLSSQCHRSTIVPFPCMAELFEQQQSLSLMLSTKTFNSAISPLAFSSSCHCRLNLSWYLSRACSKFLACAA